MKFGLAVITVAEFLFIYFFHERATFGWANLKRSVVFSRKGGIPRDSRWMKKPFLTL